MEMLAQDIKDHPDVYQYERAKKTGLESALKAHQSRFKASGHNL
jgi:hypothetical protein